MKEVLYGYRLRQSRELLALAQERTQELEEILKQFAPEVSAEWDRNEDAQGRPIVTLRLEDFSGSVTTVFELRELEVPKDMAHALSCASGAICSRFEHTPNFKQYPEEEKGASEMPSRTLEDKVEELAKLATTLQANGQVMGEGIKVVVAQNAETTAAFATVKTTVAVVQQQLLDLRTWKDSLASPTDIRTEIALLQRSLEGLEKVKDEWSRRLWAIAGPVLGAVVGILLGYYLRR